MTDHERGKQPADFEAEARVKVNKTGNVGKSTDLAPGFASATQPDGEALPSFMQLVTADNFPDFPIILLPGGFAIGQRVATFESTGLVVVMVRTPDTPWGMMTVMLPIAGLSVVNPADVVDKAELSDLGQRVPARFRLVGPVTDEGEHALRTVQGYLPAPFVMHEGEDERMVLVAEALDTLAARREAQGLPVNVVLFPD